MGPRRQRGDGLMFTGIDHIVMDVPDLAAARETFAKMGFHLGADGEILLQQSSIEDGIWAIALATDNLDQDARFLGALPVRSVMAVEQRQRAPVEHPNGVQRLERVYIAVEDVRAEAAIYAAGLGLPVPGIQRGTVINADMAVFQLGDAGLTLAQPAGPGVAAEALQRRGQKPFQALYRTTSLQQAEAWIVDHGLPKPQRGTRNTGEQAILVGPETAFGAYIGFVGPE